MYLHLLAKVPGHKKHSQKKNLSLHIKEIGLFAEEVLKDIKKEKYETEEDFKNQKKFWDIYYNFVPVSKMGQIQPKISPSFLRNNIDLLN